ncbi:hypothetical protein RIF29_30686 [Crotalaria pallida]|uniref:Uncharacterized protein n=1 Tax=Crotalaria pallida TaxID=3830 RepID=A0AAN9EIJ2_CROPI
MAPDVNFLANTAHENTDKRKKIAVELEHMEPMVQRCVRERLMKEIAVEESRSPLELQVVDLKEKLDASVARERKLKEELANLKVKFESDIARADEKVRKLEKDVKVMETYIAYYSLAAKVAAMMKKKLDLLEKAESQGSCQGG